ncbi:unnamed protein product [Cylicostephanus goldi]|uniref:Uncharacterized protein n=1 Tax=Cylicostephanus goldi TaxID=71465 RepID=A0A3P7M4B6_CYLGO|nr:unnamed protein product [Cylicostephanus goldi]
MEELVGSALGDKKELAKKQEMKSRLMPEDGDFGIEFIDGTDEKGLPEKKTEGELPEIDFSVDGKGGEDYYEQVSEVIDETTPPPVATSTLATTTTTTTTTAPPLPEISFSIDGDGEEVETVQVPAPSINVQTSKLYAKVGQYNISGPNNKNFANDDTTNNDDCTDDDSTNNDNTAIDDDCSQPSQR